MTNKGSYKYHVPNSALHTQCNGWAIVNLTLTAVTAHQPTVFQSCQGWGKPLTIFLMLKKSGDNLIPFHLYFLSSFLRENQDQN